MDAQGNVIGGTNDQKFERDRFPRSDDRDDRDRRFNRPNMNRDDRDGFRDIRDRRDDDDEFDVLDENSFTESRNMNIKKTRERLGKTESEIAKSKERLMAKCPHRVEDNFTLASMRDPNNPLLYRCKQCGKIVDINTIEEVDVEKAVKILDQMIDIIKISTSHVKDNDAKLLASLADAQYKIRNLVPKAYHAAISNTEKKKNRNRNSERSSDSVWNRAVRG